MDALTAGLAPAKPPAEWFADPALDAATAVTVTPDGRVYGHAAAWGTCHTGMPGRCVEPPRAQDGYSWFLLGSVECSDGFEACVGQITMGTGHADLRAGVHAASRHYDNTGSVVADVAVGEDEHGIWVAGAIRPDADEDAVRALKGAKLSGDWRSVNGQYRLVALLAVNVPGFPVERARALAASGCGVALVAAGVLRAPGALDHLAAADEITRLARAARVDRSKLITHARR
jgi:hypothetical protein